MVALTAMMAGASDDDGLSKFGCTPFGGVTNGILVRSKPNDDKSKVERSILDRSRSSIMKVDQSSFDRSIVDTSTPPISKPMFTTQCCVRTEQDFFSFFLFQIFLPVSLPSIFLGWVTLSSM